MYEAIEYILKEVTVLPGTGKQDGNIGHRHIDKLKDALKKREVKHENNILH